MKEYKTVSIHQPSFFPWYPFFQKIINADIFVFLTHCQFEKNGYQNRFNIDKKWHTMSTKRGLDLIMNKVYLNPEHDWKKIKKSLKKDYGLDLLREFDNCITSSLPETNIKIIEKICCFLDIKTSLLVDKSTTFKGTERLVDICLNQKGCTHYFSGVSGKNYLDTKLFKKENIDILYQKEKSMIKKPILDILKAEY
jgi:hypothetical protein